EDVEDEVPLAVEEVAREVREVEQAAQARQLSDDLHGGAAAEEVVVRDLALQHEVLDRGEAGPDLEGAGELLGDLDVEDDLVVGRPARGGDVDGREVAEPQHAELRLFLLRLGVEVALAEQHLAADDLV